MSKEITLQNEYLDVIISTLGAELQRVTGKDGTEWLWNGDPQYWTGRAPVLFPHAGGMLDDEYTYEGKTYSMPKHGFARRKEFELENVTENSATFVLSEPQDFYPFPYRLHIQYILKEKSIEIQYKIDNKGSNPLYFGIGSHEAYLTPGGIHHYSVLFEDDKTVLHRPYDYETGVSHEGVPLPVQDGVLHLKEDFFTIDAIIMYDLKSRSVTLMNDLNSRKIRVDYPDCPYLLIWKKPDAPFLCIEPWTNAPDYNDSEKEISKKPGMTRLDGGQSKILTHMLTFIN